MKILKFLIPKSILPILIFAITLNIIRIIFWNKYSYLYLLWNIFLAFIPYFISLMLVDFYQKKINKILLIIIFVLWLLFIPNSHYLITDFIHLGNVKHAPIIFDAFLLFSSSLVGLFFGLFSLGHIDYILRDKFSIKKTEWIMNFLIILIGFGMYLGRFLRFNSWDFFTNHVSIWLEIKSLFLENGGAHLFLYVFLFSSFIYVSFESWKFLKKDFVR